MSLLEKLKQGIKNHTETVFPGTEQKIKIRVLTCAEIQQCGIETEKWMKEQEAEYGTFNASLFNDENSIRTIFKAVSTLDDKPIAPDLLYFRANITDGQLQALISIYNLLQDECAPEIAKMNQKDFDTIVEEIKKKPEETIGKLSNIYLLKRLLVTMASQLSNLPTGKS